MSTLHAFLVLASEGAETSKTPFYVAGGALAVWAVVVGALGLARQDFPSSDGAKTGIMALSVVLMLAAMATSVMTG